MKYRFIKVEIEILDEKFHNWENRFICETKKHWWSNWEPIRDSGGYGKLMTLEETKIVNSLLD